MLSNNNCVFYDKYFVDDLYSYKYNSSKDKLTYYNNGKSFSDSSVNMSIAISAIEKFTNVDIKDCWIPAIIDRQTDQTKTKLLFRGTQSISENLGLESAITITDPKFQSWKIKNGYLNCDWILTSDVVPFNPLYGILFWFKRDTISSKSKQFLNADEIPYNSIVSPNKDYQYDGVSITVSSRLAKKDNDTFYICDYDDYYINQDTILPSKANRYFKISKLLEFNKDLNIEDIKFSITQTDPIIKNDPGLNLWIPNGEMYSYFYSVEEQNESYKNKKSSLSYLSPTLSSIYREIYHILTLRYKKQINKFSLDGQIVQQPIPFFSPQQSRLFKKLCYGLATFPQIDRTTVSLLNTDEIFSIVNSYINSFNNITDIRFDSSSFVKVLTSISKIITIKLNTEKSSSLNQTINSGLVTSKTDLFYRLMSKYSAKLRLYNQASIEYTPGLKYGPHVKINQDIMSRCDYTLENQTIFNNVKFEVGEFIAQTEFSNSATDLILANRNLASEKVRIPFWDIYKKKLQDQRLPITAGPDIEVDFYNDTNLVSSKKLPNPDNPETEIEIREIAITLDKAMTDIGGTFFDENILGGEDIDILWSRVSGPDCLRFSNDRISPQSTASLSLRYETSTDNNPKVYIKKPGRYVIQLRAKASFGVLYDNIVIHVNDTKNLTYRRKDRLSPAQIQYLKPKNRLVILTPNIRECYFGKQGVFWTSYCDSSVKVPLGKEIVENVNNLAQPGGSRPPTVIPFGNNYHKLAMPMPVNKKTNQKIINNNRAVLKITYNCNNTIIDINKIILSHLMDKNEQCYNCESLYEGILDNRGFILDSDNASFAFMDVTNNDQIINVPGPDTLSTDKTILKSYGGFSDNIIKSLGLSIPYHPNPGSILPSVYSTEEVLNEPVDDNGRIVHICHDTELPYNSSVRFAKGCFHPFSGWINGGTSNLSSVLKFDPYHRPIQIFKGPGMYELKNDFSDGVAKIYKSSIVLTVDAEAYDPIEDENIEDIDKKEVSDHIINYGYRTIGGNPAAGALSYNDEYDLDFPIESDAPVSNEQYCSNSLSERNYTATYTMTRPGTLIPYKDRDKRQNNSSKRLRWNREGGGSIGNIEVKLNFLNYINPKDLVIWLEIDTCSKAAESLNPSAPDEGTPPPPKDPWYNGSYRTTAQKLLNINNTDVKNYLYSLWDMNDNYQLDGKIPETFEAFPKRFNNVYRVYLLNRDHINATDFNINLKFSDLLNLQKNNSNNNISSTLFIDNNVSQSINETIDLSPTLSAAGYSDEEILKYKKIVIENELLNNSHSFKKVMGMPIFSEGPNSRRPGNASNTTFTLCVAVVGESDTFTSYDRMALTEELTLSSIKTKNKSNIVDNSICSWELILHRNTDNCGFLPGDSLGSISYEKDHPYIPGHNFIADMTDKLHLLPPSVLNAPNGYALDGRLCRYSKESFNIPTFTPPPPMNFSLITFLMPFSIVGALVSISQVEAGLNEAARELTNQLGFMRRQQQQQAFNEEWYVPVYDKYPYGGSDKILLSVSKDGSLFYKTEASIFRYDNSIVMEKNKYQFCKLHYNSYLKNLSIFGIKPITSIDSLRQLLFKKIAKRIYHKYPINKQDIERLLALNNKKIESLKEKTDEASVEQLSQIILETDKLNTNLNSIGEGIKKGDILYIVSETEDQPNIYIVYDGSNIAQSEIENLFPSEIISFNSIFKSDIYAQYNNIFDLSINPLDLESLVLSNRIVCINGLRPYYFFKDYQDITEIEAKTEFTPEESQELENLNKQLSEITKRLSYVSSLDANNIEAEKNIQEVKKLLGLPVDETNSDLLSLNIKNLEDKIFNLQNIFHTNTIQNRGYIFDGNNYISLFIMANEIKGKSLSISPSQSKRIVIYKNDMSVINNKETFPFDIWSLTTTNGIHYASPNEQNSTWGAGNYGYGSNINRPYKLSNQNIQNTITSLMNKIDTRKNTYSNSTAFNIIPNNSTEPNTMLNGKTVSPAFMYEIDTIKNTTLKNNKNVLYKENETKSKNKQFFIDFDNLIYENFSKSPSFAEMEIELPNIETIENGTVFFDKDIKQKIIYGFKEDYAKSVQKLKERLQDIQTLIKDRHIIINKADKTYVLNSAGNPISQKDNEIALLNNLLIEKNQIEYYLNATSDETSKVCAIPHVSIEINENDQALSFTEKLNNNYYWINIDPEQGCSIDTDKTPKILTKVKYVCYPYNDNITLKAKQICVANEAYGGTNGGGDGNAEGAEIVKVGYGDTEYALSEQAIQKEKAKYPDLKWPESDDANFTNYFVKRTFFLNFNGSERAQMVVATYNYQIPIAPDKVDIEPDGNITNKIMNIFNLDNTDNLIVDFKRIPRALRSKDKSFDIYEPNENGDLIKSIMPSPGGPIDGSLRVWKCLDAKTGYPIPLTNYYKILNEMIFRSHFGSIDGVEHLGRIKTKSKDETYWVPYDYS